MKTYMDNAKAFLAVAIGYLAVEWFAEALSHAMGAGR
jgi:hypothetical protein